MVPMVYFRMDLILPKTHWLNHILVKIFFYSVVFLGAYIVPTPIIIFCIRDQQNLKYSYYSKFQLNYTNFFNSSTIAVNLGLDNIGSLATIIFAGGVIAVANIVFIFCAYEICHVIKTKRAETAIGSTVKHQALVGSVGTMVSS